MRRDDETPEEKRERIRQEELKNNPGGNFKDSLNRGSTGNIADLVGGLSWKGTGILILVLIVGFIIYAAFFR
ncbi:DUF6366 family protein [Lentibacillus salicampi]|uniref:Phage capsid protein n=1 Tax=Lentibacillus salicampi TaxID=175306 RepID=A0A4Y9A7J0_9BACI|nr:DUF6366 family protein [Lentibacillus salicampi]TFJ91729.1 hypothetical protein E4U82_16185 [Lentibacillus salicampi]